MKWQATVCFGIGHQWERSGGPIYRSEIGLRRELRAECTRCGLVHRETRWAFSPDAGALWYIADGDIRKEAARV